MLTDRVFETHQKFRSFQFKENEKVFEYGGNNIKPESVLITEKTTTYGDNENPTATTVTIKLSGFLQGNRESFSQPHILKWSTDEMESQAHPISWVPDWLYSYLKGIQVLNFN